MRYQNDLPTYTCNKYFRTYAYAPYLIDTHFHSYISSHICTCMIDIASSSLSCVWIQRLYSGWSSLGNLGWIKAQLPDSIWYWLGLGNLFTLRVKIWVFLTPNWHKIWENPRFKISSLLMSQSLVFNHPICLIREGKWKPTYGRFLFWS